MKVEFLKFFLMLDHVAINLKTLKFNSYLNKMANNSKKFNLMV